MPRECFGSQILAEDSAILFEELLSNWKKAVGFGRLSVFQEKCQVIKEFRNKRNPSRVLGSEGARGSQSPSGDK